jgi:hypothetical protein
MLALLVDPRVTDDGPGTEAPDVAVAADTYYVLHTSAFSGRT